MERAHLDMKKLRSWRFSPNNVLLKHINSTANKNKKHCCWCNCRWKCEIVNSVTFNRMCLLMYFILTDKFLSCTDSANTFTEMSPCRVGVNALFWSINSFCLSHKKILSNQLDIEYRKNIRECPNPPQNLRIDPNPHLVKFYI